MIPSGYKNQKVYSAVPTDGLGDLTFSRASSATRVASNGLIEKVRTNNLLQSNTFNTTWVLSNVTITGGQTGYDGSSNAWLLQVASSGTFRRINQNTNVNSVMTNSIYAKAGTVDFIAVTDTSGSSSNIVYFDLANGVIDSIVNAGQIINAQIQAVGGGWYRCSAALTGNASGTALWFVSATGGSASNAGDNVYIQDAQQEVGDIATDYIATTTAAVSVGPVSGLPRLDYLNSSCPKLLLEPQTTALNQFSEQLDNAYYTKADVTVSANTTDTLDPSGYYGADKITETATTARHRLLSGAITMTAVNNTSSVFMKKGTARYGFVTMSGAATSTIVVDLEDGTITSTSTSGTIVAQKVDDYGNGWYRISVTALGIAGATSSNLQFGSAGSATPSYTANVPSFAGSTSNNLYAWGANLTATSYVQSYIPTLGASVTRVADVASKTGISSLIGQTEGTLFVDLNYEAITGLSMFLSIRPNSTNKIEVYRDGQTIYGDILGNSVSVLISKASSPAGRYKIALAYKSGQTALYVNGTSVGTSSTAFSFASSMEDLFVNLRSGPTFIEQAFYNQALLFKTRLTNAQLAELTA
jgi:hypothetical protein